MRRDEARRDEGKGGEERYQEDSEDTNETN